MYLWIIVIIIVIAILLYLAYYMLHSIYNFRKFLKKQKMISISELKKGDILFRKATYFGLLIPGYFTHAAIYLGKEKGIPYVVESFLFIGYRKQKLSNFLKIGKISVGRVKGINEKQIDKVLHWCESKKGCKFNYLPTKKQDSKRYFCSEFVWAAFKSIDIDIDSGKFLKFTITPQQLYNSKAIQKIGVLKRD
jgi:uncharacterized protein YycO